MKGYYCFAGIDFELETVHAYVHELCKDYLVPKSSGVRIVTGTEEIDFERHKSALEDKAEGIPIRSFSDEYLESLAVYRKIAELMPKFETVLFHGSCIAVNGEGFLFTAKSGTGKSTHTHLWRKLLGSKAIMVNDDKPLIKIGETEDMAFGTPWDGKHGLSSNISVPLKAICILERAKDNSITPITKQEAYPVLLQQIYRPADPDMLKRTLSLIDRLNVKLYRLSCNMDISAAELAYSNLKGF